MQLSDEDLNRLVDGRHSPTLQQALGERVQTDAVLAAHVDAWRTQSHALRAAFNEFADSPASPWLTLYRPIGRSYGAALIYVASVAVAFGLGLAAQAAYQWMGF